MNRVKRSMPALGLLALPMLLILLGWTSPPPVDGNVKPHVHFAVADVTHGVDKQLPLTRVQRHKNVWASRDFRGEAPDQSPTAGLEGQKGIKLVTAPGIQKTTAQIMATPPTQRPADFERVRNSWELEGPDRRNLPQSPGAIEASQWPLKDPTQPQQDPLPSAPQTLGTQFDGATGPTETGAYPPDTEGAVGPTQFFVFLNGRMRTFDKTTGLADGVLNTSPDLFFASVMTPPASGEIVFTSDPNVRFDRLSNRWFLNIIDVPLVTSTGALRANRVLIAVSNAASNGTITGSTVWTLYQFQGDPVLFTDYESLGIDASALYVGGNMFTSAGAFSTTTGFVIPKSPALTGSPLTVWAFPGLVTGGGGGPFSPRGVDNYDPSNTGPTAAGYFIGVDANVFSKLTIRRVTDPGSTSVSPTISANIFVTTPLTTSFPVRVPHLGNTRGTSGYLDGLDDRLFAAHLRNGRLWTAHNIGVNNTGAATGANRNASRWYELQDLGTTPTVVQSGTLFDNSSPNDVNQRSYWIPSITVSGQGHAALGCSIAGAGERINAFTTGRLAGDPLGTLRDGPGGTAFPGYTSSSTAYDPPFNRWGDYSFTSLDPKDDMTMWTIQEYCNGTNTYGVRAVELIAPPPAIPASSNPPNVTVGQPSADITIIGTSVSGSGFFDPGADPPGGTPFAHLSASVTGGVTVNSVTYIDQTHLVLNISTVGATAGPQSVTITNPDGQSLTGTNLLAVGPGETISLAAVGVPYTQDFNTLAITGTSGDLPTGWAFSESGTNADTTYSAGDGSTNAGNTYSFGSTGSTDRAFGELRSGSLVPIIGAIFANNTGSSITSIVVSYTGEQWRLGTLGRPDQMNFQLSTDATDLATGTYTDYVGLDFVAPITSGSVGSLNGNAAANRTNITFTITGLNIPNNGTFVIRWTDLDATGADDGLSLDDFSLTPQSPAPTTAIHDIQGSGIASPLVGQILTTTGIVTGVKPRGFFIQAPDGSTDADPNTSEGIFVFTTSVPPGVALGNLVQVSGAVAEFVPPSDRFSPSLTEITAVAGVTLLSTGNPLPTPVTLTSGDFTNSIHNLERYEGMRVAATPLTVVGPTSGSTDEVNATSASSGLFFGVLSGTPRPFWESGIRTPNPPPPGSPANVPVFDANPERLCVHSDELIGSTAIEVTAGATVTNLVGPLDYAFSNYTLLTDPGSNPDVSGNGSAIAVPAPAANEISLGSFNLNRFFDTVDAPGVPEPVLTSTAFDNRLNKLSLTLRNFMGTPDIIGVQEVENLSTLQAIAARVNSDAVAAADPNPNYQSYLVDGNDAFGIDVGFLVKASRITVVDVTQFGLNDTYINPATGLPEILNDRPPLVLRATITPPGGLPFPFTVIVNHLRSLGGIVDTASAGPGVNIRAKRRAQAEFLANLIQARQTADPNEHIICLGDFNAFEFNDGYVDVMGTVTGNPTPADQVVLASGDLVNPDLINLTTMAPGAQRYSYVFDGSAQQFDHVLISSNLAARVEGIHYARSNADFPESFRNTATRPERVSDHDPVLAYLSLPVSVASGAPIVNSPILAGATSVSGTSTEANGTVIEVFVNSVSAGTTTVSASAWLKSGLAALVAGDTVKATATASGELTSAFSSPVIVQDVTTAPVVNSPILAGATSVSGTSSEPDGTVIGVFVNSASAGTTTVTGGVWTKSGLVAAADGVGNGKPAPRTKDDDGIRNEALPAGLVAGDTVKATATATGKLESAFSNSVIVSPAGGSVNVITNPGFESGKSPWVFFTDGTGTYSLVSPGTTGANAARLTITTPGTNTQFYQSGVTLEAATLYRLTFKALSSTGHNLSVYVQRHDSPYTSYGLNGLVFDLTPSWQTFTVQFTTINFPPPSPSNARLRFRLNGFATAGDQYFIDDVVLEKVAGGGPVATKIVVETAANGTGSVVPAQVVNPGDSITVYAIARDAGNNFVGNIAGTWSLINVSGSVVAGDLVPSGDAKSATFKGNGAGKARIQAASGGLTPTPSNTITVPTPPPAANLVVNGGFESGTANWTFQTNGAGTFTAVTPGNVGSKAGQVAITTQGTGVQLFQRNISLTSGNQYRLSFKARSNTGHDVQVSVFRHTSPFTPFGLSNHVFNLTGSWADYSVDFTAGGFGGTFTDARLRFWLSPYDAAGDVYKFDDVRLELLPVPPISGAEALQEMPSVFTLGANFPNPFNPSTTIVYTLPEDAHVTIEVFDVLGRSVTQLVNADIVAGYHDVVFDASALSSGLYFYRMTATGAAGAVFSHTQKMLLAK